MITQRPQRKPAGSGNPNNLMDVGQLTVSVSRATRAFSFQFLPRSAPYSGLFLAQGHHGRWGEVLFSVPCLCLCHIKLNTKTFSPKAKAVSVPLDTLRESTACGSVEMA